MLGAMITIEEIRNARQKLDEKLASVQNELSQLDEQYQELQRTCPHVDSYLTHNGRRCDDCGWHSARGPYRHVVTL